MKNRLFMLLTAATLLIFAGCSQSADPLENGEERNVNSQADIEKQHPEKKPTVYITEDISPQGLNAVYEALNASPSGNVAVKLSTGEPGSNYLRPQGAHFANYDY